MTSSRIAFLLVLTAVTSCRPHVPQHSEFGLGASRAEVEATFGAPTRTQTFTKTGDAIWGPIETFWQEVPMGATVEVWAFESRQTVESPEGAAEQTGETELYFIDGSNTVDGIGFHVQGAVYEGS